MNLMGNCVHLRYFQQSEIQFIHDSYYPSYLDGFDLRSKYLFYTQKFQG